MRTPRFPEHYPIGRTLLTQPGNCDHYSFPSFVRACRCKHASQGGVRGAHGVGLLDHCGTTSGHPSSAVLLEAVAHGTLAARQRADAHDEYVIGAAREQAWSKKTWRTCVLSPVPVICW
jgi:hypothetical protein